MGMGVGMGMGMDMDMGRNVQPWGRVCAMQVEAGQRGAAR
jgi:hypothetical protein